MFDLAALAWRQAAWALVKMLSLPFRAIWSTAPERRPNPSVRQPAPAPSRIRRLRTLDETLTLFDLKVLPPSIGLLTRCHNFDDAL